MVYNIFLISIITSALILAKTVWDRCDKYHYSYFIQEKLGLGTQSYRART